MGDCSYCGKPAGLFRSQHAECQQKHELGKQNIISLVSSAASATISRESLQNNLKEIASQSFVSEDEQKALLVTGWESAVEQFLEDGFLEESEERKLLDLQETLALSKSDIAGSGALLTVVKAAVIRDVLKGIIPQRASISDGLPINFQKDEKIVWGFPNSEYLEDRTRRQYVGGSQGVSIRIMRGLYYRAGAFKGEAVDRTERIHVDTGWVVITNKHIYFAGPKKSLRVPYGKILSFQSFSNGIGLIRDASSAKPQVFVTGDGWFTYNLVTNLARL